MAEPAAHDAPDSGLRLLENIDAVPSIHGRSAFALEVRRLFLARRYAAVAIELPPSLREPVIEAVRRLPTVSCVVYREAPPVYSDEPHYAYVPVDPCDSIIEAARLAIAERVPLFFIDAEEIGYEPPVVLPDEFAIRRLGLKRYYQAVRPVLAAAAEGSARALRERQMAAHLRVLKQRFASVLFVCGMAHLEGIERNLQGPPSAPLRQQPGWLEPPQVYDVRPRTLVFALGELPYQAALYERCRASLEQREYQRIDGLKELLIEARKRYGEEFPEDVPSASPQAFQLILKYIRNLCLVQSRLTPNLYEIIVACKGVLGGPFARVTAETARDYPYLDPAGGYPSVAFGKDGLILPDGPVKSRSRMPGRPLSWREVKLDRPPERFRQRWRTGWNPFAGSCSWPPEDVRIEGFAARVRHRARQVMTRDLARSEKFQTSIRDGLDIRETLRHWHKREIYVKVAPPALGGVGAVVFVFDEDESRYPNRMTWHAEHQNESTIACYATDMVEDFVGPGIARARYGGSVFLYPPLLIPDIWEDPRFDIARNAVERITLVGMYYSKEKAVAYVGHRRPSLRLRELARKLGRRLIFLPLKAFSPSGVAKLRVFHILNGHAVRSYAARFIQ